MRKYINKNYKHILHGGDYNPDQWLDRPDILSEDMRLMKLANCNEMTVGIFSWAALEPDEGRFNFLWLDKVMDDIYLNGGRVILATPSGARPVWLAHQYPEVLRVDQNGNRFFYGGRHNHCYTSPIYREKVTIINRKLAERYKDHPALLAWHISNEYSGECYCDLCKAAFRGWLKKKYGTIDELNHQWWTAFWAHTYNDWEQIDPPSSRGDTAVHGKNLDWKRFVTEQTADFMNHECETVKSIAPNIPTTTNLMGFYDGLDYRVIAKYIDFISVDNYPDWHGDESDIERSSKYGMINDLMRSLKQKPFMLMECTVSCVSWHPINKLKRPRVHNLFALQTIAHGSDSVLCFQWRKSRGCSEKLHGAIIDHEGSENTRVFREVSALGKRLKKLDEIVGTLTKSMVAIIYDWPNHWALNDARGFYNKDKKMMYTIERIYQTLWNKGIDVDIISTEDDFSEYRFIIDPMQYMISSELGKKLEKFVYCGGTLLCTYMTGMVNENDLCHLGGFPGAGLRKVFGIWNEEIDTLYPNESNEVLLSDGTTVQAIEYCELIHAEGAKVLGVYSSDFYKGMPAVTVNGYGKGEAYYVAFRESIGFMEKLISDILTERGIASAFDGELPYGISAHSRTDGETLYVFVENHKSEPQTVNTQLYWYNVENGEPVNGDIRLDKYDVIVLKRDLRSDR